MYLPVAFEEKRLDVLHAFVAEHPFGLLVTHGAAGLLANPLPFLLDPGGALGLGVLRGHVARANPVREDTGSGESLAVFQGPHGYVSPAWYPSKAAHGKVVPTWNYMMVQVRGPLRVIDDPRWLRELVTRLTDRHEAIRPEPWAVDDAPETFVQTMLGAIVGVEIDIAAITGKWKLSQNRSAEDRAGVIAGLLAVADGAGDPDADSGASGHASADAAPPASLALPHGGPEPAARAEARALAEAVRNAGRGS